MKNKKELRIVDKAVTLTKQLISLLDGDLRVENLSLSQNFNEDIAVLFNLQEKLYSIENKLYNQEEI